MFTGKSKILKGGKSMFTGKSKITKVFSVFVASLFVLSGVPASANASENAAVDGSLVYPAGFMQIR